MARNTITGGAFEDAQGNVIAYGTLVLRLTVDVALNAAQGFVCAGVLNTIPLDASGNVVSTLIWPTDQMLPNTATYVAWVLNANNAIAWGPHQVQILSSPSPYNLSAWTP